jgi:natural product biosynthesis luciferase-like monooxygenase protein
MDLSLSFFSSSTTNPGKSGYGFLVDCAKYADQHGLRAIWTPERHFHAFGGAFPNPSLTGVLLASVTSRIRIRAGSVVLPLHQPVRVAEEWSVVDNISAGRVDLAFATGWHPDDFVLAPQNYEDRIDKTFAGIETIRQLWRGQPWIGRNGRGDEISVHLQPPPVQTELPVWMTCTGRPRRFEQAGQNGFNVLTALIFQNTEALTERIAEYRAALRTHGHGAGKVTLMLHTHVGETPDETRKAVREPLKAYLKSSVELWKKNDPRLARLLARPDGLELAAERYYRDNGLFGTIDRCLERLNQLTHIGVDEIACLIDFGVDTCSLRHGLRRLCQLQELASATA